MCLFPPTDWRNFNWLLPQRHFSTSFARRDLFFSAFPIFLRWQSEEHLSRSHFSFFVARRCRILFSNLSWSGLSEDSWGKVTDGWGETMRVSWFLRPWKKIEGLRYSYRKYYKNANKGQKKSNSKKEKNCKWERENKDHFMQISSSNIYQILKPMFLLGKLLMLLWMRGNEIQCLDSKPCEYWIHKRQYLICHMICHMAKHWLMSRAFNFRFA